MLKGLNPEFKDNFWYTWATFIDQFRKKAIDPLGKFGGCFLSQANKQNTYKFRSLAFDELHRTIYFV
jgi:hypothetical protein